MKNILEVCGLNKSYRNFALQDVSFSLPEGCITGFIGVNGAGKTTTLKTILGLTPKDSGETVFLTEIWTQKSRPSKNGWASYSTAAAFTGN